MLDFPPWEVMVFSLQLCVLQHIGQRWSGRGGVSGGFLRRRDHGKLLLRDAALMSSACVLTAIRPSGDLFIFYFFQQRHWCDCCDARLFVCSVIQPSLGCSAAQLLDCIACYGVHALKLPDTRETQQYVMLEINQ